MATVLLVTGYAVAVVVLARARVVVRERRWRWFVALELATAAVILGYALAGTWIGAALNIVNLVVIAVVWRWTGRPGLVVPDHDADG